MILDHKGNPAIRLPIREWLELGQVLTDLHPMPPKYFRADSTLSLGIGEGCKLKADGKIYRAGRYVLDRTTASARMEERLARCS
jgi:hypothetical protein